MIIYLDTSALVPLLIEEPTTAACRDVWDQAEVVLATPLGYVEAAAALAMAERMGRIAPELRASCQTRLERLWESVHVLEIDESVMRRAAAIAVQHGLRGYDAMHCAAASSANDDVLVAVSGDRDLLAAFQAEGVATLDTSRSE